MNPALIVSTLLAAISAAPPLHASQDLPSRGDGGHAVGAAMAHYQGTGLSVAPTARGVSLTCVFQRLRAEATPDGLWLVSTAAGADQGRFQMIAARVGREADFPLAPFATDVYAWRRSPLPETGTVQAGETLVRFAREGLTEEYSVDFDGIRQDFIVPQRPDGEGRLILELAVAGGEVHPRGDAVELTMEGSGRKLLYHKLHVSDALGQPLNARFEIEAGGKLLVSVDDENAAYPVRIDPTFSDANWVSLNGLPGVDDTVNAVAFDASNNLYVGGSFFTAGNVVARRIAKWDGTNWSSLNGGLNGTVNAIAISGNDVYVGGSFTTAEDGNLTNGIIISVNGVAKWNGSEWQSLDAGVSGTVNALLFDGGYLYAGGSINVGGSRVAKWDGLRWSGVGAAVNPGMNGNVNALAVYNGDLIAGGAFTVVDGSTIVRIARWNGTAWSALGAGIGGGTSPSVNALAVMGSDLYASGTFTIAGPVSPANNIAKWNGTTWSSVGSGLGGAALALAASGGSLYAGGAFTTAGGNSANRIARWDGAAWSPVDTGATAQVNALSVSGSNLAAGGTFTSRPGVRVGIWNGTEWSGTGSGLRNPVSALAISGNDVILGGSFVVAGPAGALNIARWDGGSYSAVGRGLNGPVTALLVSGNDLYVGGSFTRATNSGGDAVPANSIAKWNGTAWSALDAGVNSNVFALAMIGSNLYAGGRFTTAGGSPAFGIASWNGTSWSPVGGGLNATVSGSVIALAAAGGNLYAGGVFTVATNAGGNPVTVNRIAKWDGSLWSALGAGMNADVNALAVSGSTLFAGGYFNTAGSASVGRIAQWDGTNWSVLGSGTNNIFVYSLAVAGSDLYCGGTFSTAGGTLPANNIAKWDGTTWTALGSGLTGTTIPAVNALAVRGGELFVGGSFYMAGDKASQYFAEAVIGGIPLPGRFDSPAYSPVTGFACRFLDASIGQAYRIQTSPRLTNGGWSDFTNFVYTGPTNLNVPLAGPPTNKFIRAITP